MAFFSAGGPVRRDAPKPSGVTSKAAVPSLLTGTAMPVGPTPQQVQAEQYRQQTEEATAKKQAELDNAYAASQAQSYSGSAAPARMPASMAALPGPTYQEVWNREDTKPSDNPSFNVQRQDTLHTQSRNEGLEDENRTWSRITPYIDAIMKPVDFSSSMSAGVGGALPGGSASAASDMAFARAKDKAGLLAGAKMKNLRETAASAGFDSSGRDLRHAESILDDTGGYLADVATAQATDESEAARALENRNFNAALSTRNANMSMLPSLLALTRRAY